MWEIDETLKALKDGKWHHLEEIAEKSSIQESKVEMIVNFLADYDFIRYNRDGRKVKLPPLTRKFIDEVYGVEEEEDMRALRLR